MRVFVWERVRAVHSALTRIWAPGGYLDCIVETSEGTSTRREEVSQRNLCKKKSKIILIEHIKFLIHDSKNWRMARDDLVDRLIDQQYKNRYTVSNALQRPGSMHNIFFSIWIFFYMTDDNQHIQDSSGKGVWVRGGLVWGGTFSSSLPLPRASRTLTYQLGNYC